MVHRTYRVYKGVRARLGLGRLGFSLIELLVVLCLLTIIVSLAIASLFTSKEDSRRVGGEAMASSINQAIDRVRLVTPGNDGINNYGLPPELLSTNVIDAIEWLYLNGYIR
jgi:prepilin-type N-terminal cleavage/methylation domain-containing protein